MLKKSFLLISLIFVIFTVYATETSDTIAAVTTPTKAETPWSVTVQGSYSYAFGDDSWNLKDDRDNAKGWAVSFSLGREITPVFEARVKARFLKLYSRVNLEVMDAYKHKYPSFFPRDGFYGYNALAFEAEAMFNLANLVHRTNHFFNIYLIGGLGVNTTFGYDENVHNWDGSYDGLRYDIDTKAHTMPLAVIGGMLDFRVTSDLSVNLEALGTFTGDKMEGVKYEENYDVYITVSLGATFRF